MFKFLQKSRSSSETDEMTETTEATPEAKTKPAIDFSQYENTLGTDNPSEDERVILRPRNNNEQPAINPITQKLKIARKEMEATEQTISLSKERNQQMLEAVQNKKNLFEHTDFTSLLDQLNNLHDAGENSLDIDGKGGFPYSVDQVLEIVSGIEATTINRMVEEVEQLDEKFKQFTIDEKIQIYLAQIAGVTRKSLLPEQSKMRDCITSCITGRAITIKL